MYAMEFNQKTKLRALFRGLSFSYSMLDIVINYWYYFRLTFFDFFFSASLEFYLCKKLDTLKWLVTSNCFSKSKPCRLNLIRDLKSACINCL